MDKVMGCRKNIYIFVINEEVMGDNKMCQFTMGDNCCYFFLNNDIRRNLVHFDFMFATKVWLVFKSTHFAITLISILFVTIVVSAKVAYVVTL